MFKLVIVEDEDNIRHSLECFIPWEKMGFEVAGAFSDGSDALSYIKENPCDAVLTDILMSRMSGLELARNLHELMPQIKVVILSGHSDFAYAQQAIAHKVEHYLVKPVDEDELMGVFCGIKEQLVLERQELSLAESESKEMKQMLQKSFFRDLLTGHIRTDEELAVYLKLLSLDGELKNSPLCAYEIKTGLDEGLEETFFNQIASPESGYLTVPVEDKNDRVQIVFVSLSQQNNESLGAYANGQMESLVHAMNVQFDRTFSYQQTHSVTRISDLLTKMQSAAQTEATVPEQELDDELWRDMVSQYRLLTVELDLGSMDTLNHLLNGLLQNLKDTPLKDMRFILKNLYSLIDLYYKKRKIDVRELTKGKFNADHLYSSENFQTISRYIKDDFGALCQGMKDRKTGSDHSIIAQVLAYVDEHITENISHDVIAARYHLHPSYLSRLFKQEVGETLTEYLLRIRIEKAAALLKTGRYKVSQIAEMVGYSASSYFSIMFKKFTGFSPREYSQRVSL